MNGYEFRKWIEAGYKNYGKDPWFFIRELAQNSRDAGAASIHVTVKYTPGKEEVLIFEDDGMGMSYDHAVRYLFRLYASSKTREKYAAGMFGIGFWTVLKFEPASIVIQSRCKNKSWGVRVDSELNTIDVPGDMPHTGTRITLTRPPQETSERRLARKTEEALRRYCLYLRRNNRSADPLPVYFSGQNITRPMKLPGPVSLNFKKGSVEGAVGLGPRPGVHLYARGLPVFEGNTLDELSHIPPAGGGRGRKRKELDVAQGLAPVFLLNGNHLEVNISRRRVIDNRNLEKVRKIAEQALGEMVELAADCVSPRGLPRQFTDMIKRALSSVSRSFFKTLVISLLLILPLEVFLLTSFLGNSARKNSSALLSIQVEKAYYPGATVRKPGAGKPLTLSYSPAGDVMFKLFTADRYTVEAGFMRAVDRDGEKAESAPFPPVRCSSGGIDVQLEIPGPGRIFLPQAVQPGTTPTSANWYAVDPSSITINKNPAPPGSARFYSSGEAVAGIPAGGVIRYRCCPVGKAPGLTPEKRRRLTRLPGDLGLPGEIEQELAALRQSAAPVRQKVEKALELTTTLLKYDVSTETVNKYKNARSEKQRDWFRSVTAIGTGDCDILNGLTTLFLRKMDVPARLVIGALGENGKILPGLHAWVEYFDHRDRQNIVDATLLASPLNNGAAGKQPGRGRRTALEEKLNLSRQSVVYFLAAVIVFLLFIFFVVLVRLKRSSRSFQPEVLTQVREDLAGMVLHDLLHPGAWGREQGIRNFKLIPTIDGKLVSLRQALKMAEKQRLFTVTRRNPLARSLVKAAGRRGRGFCILDAGCAAFAPVVKLLPGAVHLEKIAALKPMGAEKIKNPAVRGLLEAVNGLLESRGGGMPPCLPAPGLYTGNFFDVDLSLLPPLRHWEAPNRFIAINPNSSRIKRLADLFQKNPPLAQFRFIQALLKESNQASSPPGRILERISRHLLDRLEQTGERRQKR
jgi:hypothetical protein